MNNRRRKISFGIQSLTRRRIWIAAMLLSLAVMGSILRVNSEQPPEAKRETVAVKLGRFVKTVPIQGEIRTYRPAIVYNDCRWYEREIVELVPEGTWVEKGDLICELDSAEIRDKLKQQQTELIRAKASLQFALAQRELQNAHNARRTAAGSFQSAMKSDLLKAFEEAESVQTRELLQDELLLQREQTDLARENYERTRLFTALGFRSSSELNSKQIAFESALRSVDRAKDSLFHNDQYQQPRTMLQLRTEAELAEKDVRRIDLQCQLTNYVTTVSVLEAQQWVAGVQNFVDYMTRAIEACEIYAPQAGELIYCHQRDAGKFIEVGSKVHYMQDLIRIADRSQMTVAGKVSDRLAHELQVGQIVDVTIPTLPGISLAGTLTWIAPIPSQGAWYLPNDLHHKVQVLLDDDPQTIGTLTLSSSARGAVVVDDRPGVLQIPVGAVFPYGEGYAVLVDSGQGLDVRPVTLGVSNDTTVEVVDGLQVHERVVIDQRYELRRQAELLSPAPDGRQRLSR